MARYISADRSHRLVRVPARRVVLENGETTTKPGISYEFQDGALETDALKGAAAEGAEEWLDKPENGNGTHFYKVSGDAALGDSDRLLGEVAAATADNDRTRLRELIASDDTPGDVVNAAQRALEVLEERVVGITTGIGGTRARVRSSGDGKQTVVDNDTGDVFEVEVPDAGSQGPGAARQSGPGVPEGANSDLDEHEVVDDGVTPTDQEQADAERSRGG